MLCYSLCHLPSLSQASRRRKGKAPAAVDELVTPKHAVAPRRPPASSIKATAVQAAAAARASRVSPTPAKPARRRRSPASDKHGKARASSPHVNHTSASKASRASAAADRRARERYSPAGTPTKVAVTKAGAN